MKIITIGRSSNNDIHIDDPLVSRTHCQIVRDDNGNFRLIDTNSKNGIYVNGIKVQETIKLKQTDIVRIGNTILPWQNYFSQLTIDTSKASISPQVNPNTPFPNTPDPTAQQSGLGTIALVLSLFGAGLLIYCAIRIMRWGIFAIISNTSTLILVSCGINILAGILAGIANAKDHKDSDAADIAKGISFFCIFAVVAFFLYVKFGDPDLLNPFRKLFG